MAPGLPKEEPESSLGAHLRALERSGLEEGALRRSRGSSRVSVDPAGALFGVPEGQKTGFGEPTKDPSSRRYDISMRPKSPVQPLVARVGAQMRQISLSWWPRWPALGYKSAPIVSRASPGGPCWDTNLSPKSPVKGSAAHVGLQMCLLGTPCEPF